MTKIIAVTFAIFSALFWALNLIGGHVVVQYLPALPSATIRFVIAAIFILIVLLIKEKNFWPIIKRNLIAYTVIGLIGITAFNYFFFLGLQYTSPVNGSLIMATNPIITLILSVLFLKESIKNYQKIGILFSVIGVVIVITHASINTLIHLKISIGDGIIMLANICFALYTVLSKRFIKQGNAIVNTASSMIIGTIILVLLSLPTFPHAQVLLNFPWHVDLAFLSMGILGTVLAFLFWNYSIHHLGASHTAIFLNLMPVFTMIISAFIGINVTLLQILGAILVILGVLTSSGTLQGLFNKNLQ